MKKSVSLFLSLLFVGLAAFGQQTAVPQGMKFQAVARDLGGKTLANRQVNLQVSLLAMGADGQRVFYTENQKAATNQLGLFDLTIGQGKAVLGDFAQVPWATEEIWIEFKIDEKGTGDYQTVSTTRLLAVPYAFHAATAGEIAGGPAVAGDPNNPEACAAGSVTGTLWSTGSNCATSATAKLGTADYRQLKVVTNGVERQLITPDGKIFFREDVSLDKDLSVLDDVLIGGDITTADQSASRRLLVKTEESVNLEKFNEYPVRIEADNGAMAIRLNGGDADYSFASFWDGGGERGAITGQSFGDLYSDPFFIVENAVYAIELVYVALDITGLTTELATVELQVLTAAEGIGIGIQLAAITTKLVQLTAEYTTWLTEKNLSVGVSYSSGSADYAEWLEKADPSQRLFAGQIVGVKNGKISLKTAGADHVMALSTAPIVVGNVPPAGRKGDFEKVAFMGQIPVRVIGKGRAGDFILASGNADGFAVAVAPENMKIEDYDRIVGVAWEDATNDLANSVNVAVGINSNDMADRIAVLARDMADTKRELAAIKAFLKGETKTLETAEPTFLNEKAAAPTAATELKKALAATAFSDDQLEKMRPQLEANLQKVLAQIAAGGVDVEKSIPAPSLAMLRDPVQTIKDVQSGKHGQTILDRVSQLKTEKARK